MSSLAMDIAADDDLRREEQVDGDDEMDRLPDQQEEEEDEEEDEDEDDDDEDYDENSSLQLHDEDGHAHNVWILVAREARLYSLAELQAADIIPPVGFTGAPDDPAVAKALKTVEAPADERDCPICLQDDDDDVTAVAGAWKETPCGHRFHGRCMERWLHAEGSCPMCRRQVVTKPTTPDTSSNASLHSALAEIFEVYGQDVVMQLQEQLPL